MIERLTVFVALFLLPAGVFAAEKTVVTSADGLYTLSNAAVEAVFSGKDFFDIRKLVLGGKSVVHEGMNRTPWILIYKGVQGENPELKPEHAVYKGVQVREEPGAKTLVFTWELTLDYSSAKYPVRMSVTLPDEGELLAWDLEADLPEKWLVTDLKFPRLVVGRPAGARVITTEGWGVERKLEIGTFQARYPSHASSMQFILVHNPEGAFYYGTEDRRGCGKTYSAECSPSTVTFSNAIPASAGWISRGTFRLPWRSLTGFNPRGWEDAVVRWYRPFTFTTEWGSKPLAVRAIPQWCYDADAWVRARHVTDATLDAVLRAAEFFGPGLGVHWYFWHNHPYDTHYPDYLPAQSRFAEMVHQTQQAGARVTPYINGRLWDPAAGSYRRDRGFEASCRKPDGSLYTEIYPTSRVLNTVTCPSTDIWHRKIIGLIDSLQQGIGVDGIYIDQIAAAAPEPCWNPRHGHPLGGGDFWYDGYRRLIGKIRAGHLSEGRILTSEENAECYIDLFDMLLVVNTPHEAERCVIRPVFPMVYSDRAVMSAFTYTPTRVEKMGAGDFRYELAKALLWGAQIGWVDPVLLMDKRVEREARFMRNLMQFRRGVHDVVYGGLFLRELTPSGDNPEVEIPGFGRDTRVLAAEWRKPDGSRVYLVVNMDDVRHRVSLPGVEQPFDVAAASCRRIDL
ncbi:DUF6259 domain-containing protein [Alistipes sp.]|uniref:DUF6259 domain-containing protein n=1 Tax=Alistipes sp. TaxID=1872444 RepID=UPI0025B958E6|nr:DUF6259 domain-containing protein [Alistipes sp.]